MSLAKWLATVEPFNRLSSADCQRLGDAARERRYQKGETVFRAGEPGDQVFIVKEGRVHLMKFLPTGQASTTCVMTAKELFCCLPSLDGKPYAVDAIAAADSTIVRIPTQLFQQLMQQRAPFLSSALDLLCGRLRHVEDRSCMAFDPVERRLANVLISLREKFGSTIPLTKHELAEMANTTVETTIRILSQFKKDGLISSARGSSTIVDLEALKRLASD